MFSWLKTLIYGYLKAYCFEHGPFLSSTLDEVEKGLPEKLPARLKHELASKVKNEVEYWSFAEKDDETGYVHHLRFFPVTTHNQSVLTKVYGAQSAEFDAMVAIGQDDFLNPIVLGFRDQAWKVFLIDLEVDSSVFEVADDIDYFFDHAALDSE